MATMPLSELIKVMELEPHVEGGYYKETFRDTDVMLAADSLPANCKSCLPMSSYAHHVCILFVKFSIRAFEIFCSSKG